MSVPPPQLPATAICTEIVYQDGLVSLVLIKRAKATDGPLRPKYKLITVDKELIEVQHIT